MIGQAKKLIARIGQVWSLLGAGFGIRYALAALVRFPAVLRNRSLQPADLAMQGEARFRFNGREVVVPFTAVDAANPIPGDGPTFASIREILCEEVYLRGFKRLAPITTFVDLGANRGMVSLMAAAGLGASKVVSVEAQSPYSACWDVLAEANRLTPDQRHRVVKFAGASDDDQTITVDGLCAQFGLERIDFLKCDIEGGENAVVLGGAPAFWHRVGQVAMELHPEADTRTDEIIETLVADGFHVSVTDPDGHAIETMKATYLYASRDAGDLLFPVVANP
ncbi:MAG: FkbM family methyltransferase [Pseudomonadota bacterium]